MTGQAPVTDGSGPGWGGKAQKCPGEVGRGPRELTDVLLREAFFGKVARGVCVGAGGGAATPRK